MRLLVAGGSGFLGRNFLLAAPRDWEVSATFFTSETFPAWLEASGLDHVSPIRVDLRDPGMVEKTLGSLRSDASLYLAADTRVAKLVDDPPLDVHNNIAPIANVLHHCRGGSLVFASSGAVYMGHRGPVSPETPVRPTIPYAISKLAAELYARSAYERGWFSGCLILRFFGAYGPFEPSRKITTKLVRAARAHQRDFTIFGDGGNLIDVMYVDDAVRGLLAAVRGSWGHQTVDLCAGSPVTLNEFANRVGRIFGHTFELRHDGESPEYIRFHTSPDAMYDVLGVRPEVQLEAGMKRLDDWLRQTDAGP